uniref:alkaline phosphatase n=1 Tax=Chromobacterium haemolyticum TaxID=394935 RepID=UPI001F07C158
NTLIVVTADHDHTLVLNGYAQRTGKTTPSNPGVLGLVKNYSNGSVATDADGMPYSIIGFGNGENRVNGNRNAATVLTDAAVSANDYHQEAAVRMPAGGETHGAPMSSSAPSARVRTPSRASWRTSTCLAW